MKMMQLHKNSCICGINSYDFFLIIEATTAMPFPGTDTSDLTEGINCGSQFALQFIFARKP